MRNNRTYRLGDLQLRIMRVLWNSAPASVADVQHQLGGGLAYTTIATMLRKMEDRGLIRHNEQGRKFFYQPAVSARDVTRSMADDLVDLVVMGTGYRPHGQRYGEFASLCHYYGLPAFVCLNCGTISPDATIDGRHVVERFRGRISSMWSEDIDGLHLFNLFASAMSGQQHVPFDELKQVGGPEKLIGKDKLYEAGSYGVWVDRDILADPAERPRLVDARPVLLKIGDPVARLAREGRIRELRLQVRVSELLEEESVQIRINGCPVGIADRSREEREEGPYSGPYQVKGGGYWFEALPDAPPVRPGFNYVVVSPGEGCMGKAASYVEDVQMWVRHTDNG